MLAAIIKTNPRTYYKNDLSNFINLKKNQYMYKNLKMKN